MIICMLVNQFVHVYIFLRTFTITSTIVTADSQVATFPICLFGTFIHVLNCYIMVLRFNSCFDANVRCNSRTFLIQFYTKSILNYFYFVLSFAILFSINVS